ncbi:MULTISPECIES: phosphodiester glycosidase family protein [Arsenicicoccus]|uniref:phosphodiester glycosidase family protein n=1 Tax=Arsenicicoccus TaxID=267408 RepID=UPI002580CA5D|nr:MULTISPECIES: phosphodiester glycosidase family protein [Arsenicicoccus]
MTRTRRPAVVLAAVAVPAALVAAATAVPASATSVPATSVPEHRHPRPGSPTALHLGAPGLPESRVTTPVQRGVTRTVVTRGTADPALRWVVEVNMPALGSSNDPDTPTRSIQDRAAADAQRARLAGAGFPAVVEEVRRPAAADVPAGVLGYRLRLVERTADKAAADALVARLKAAGFASRSWYSGWDGDVAAKGPWTVNVITIDPRTFRGRLGATYGPDLERREKTSALAGFTRATAAINAGFFVMDPTAGAEGDPAGAAVYDGRLLSETVAGRPALALDPKARHTRVVNPVWTGELVHAQGRVRLDGINRVIGLIRNCGGDLTDLPTALPLHDVTCRDSAEAVAYTREFGARTPSGPGAEVVLHRGRVIAVHTSRGTVLGRGQTSVQATGQTAAALARLRVGDRAGVEQALTDDGRRLDRKGTTVVNGGPELVRDGALHVTQKRDGMHQPDNPSFDYGWVLQRNPRTFAGVDRAGRTMLVTVDGRQLGELGLSIPEAAQVAKDLGMVDAINLDGGGSTAMVVRGRLVTHPSDATGERPVGDAIVVR